MSRTSRPRLALVAPLPVPPAASPAPMSAAEVAARDDLLIPGDDGRAFRRNTRPDHLQIVDD